MIWIGTGEYEWRDIEGDRRLPFTNYAPNRQISLNFKSSCCNLRKAIAFLLF